MCSTTLGSRLTHSYILQAIRLSALRTTDDSLTPRIIALDPSFSLNPYITASGLSDLDRWPEIKRALDSPPLDPVDRPRRRPSDERAPGGSGGGARGLSYTQTIMGGRSGALGMRVTGRARGEKREGRANSSSSAAPPSPIAEKTPRRQLPTTDGFFSPSGRPRADSAPAPKLLQPSPSTSVITTGRGMGSGIGGTGLLEQALSASDLSGEIEEEDAEDGMASGLYDPTTVVGMSARPSDLGLDSGDAAGALGQTLIDEGSDVDDDEIEEEGDLDDETRELPDIGGPSNRSSIYPGDTEELDFAPVPIQPRQSISGPSGLTALLTKHVPHLVSAANAPEAESTVANPFTSLYASAAALSNVPSISLELYFPHSDQPTKPLVVKVRKDATVEEVTGYGLFRYWEDQWQPLLSEQETEQRWSTVGWGLRIVEDDGEVDEDFPRMFLSCATAGRCFALSVPANSRLPAADPSARPRLANLQILVWPIRHRRGDRGAEYVARRVLNLERPLTIQPSRTRPRRRISKGGLHASSRQQSGPARPNKVDRASLRRSPILPPRYPAALCRLMTTSTPVSVPPTRAVSASAPRSATLCCCGSRSLRARTCSSRQPSMC